MKVTAASAAARESGAGEGGGRRGWLSGWVRRGLWNGGQGVWIVCFWMVAGTRGVLSERRCQGLQKQGDTLSEGLRGRASQSDSETPRVGGGTRLEASGFRPGPRVHDILAIETSRSNQSRRRQAQRLPPSLVRPNHAAPHHGTSHIGIRSLSSSLIKLVVTTH